MFFDIFYDIFTRNNKSSMDKPQSTVRACMQAFDQSVGLLVDHVQDFSDVWSIVNQVYLKLTLTLCTKQRSVVPMVFINSMFRVVASIPSDRSLVIESEAEENASQIGYSKDQYELELSRAIGLDQSAPIIHAKVPTTQSPMTVGQALASAGRSAPISRSPTVSQSSVSISRPSAASQSPASISRPSAANQSSVSISRPSAVSQSSVSISQPPIVSRSSVSISQPPTPIRPSASVSTNPPPAHASQPLVEQTWASDGRLMITNQPQAKSTGDFGNIAHIRLEELVPNFKTMSREYTKPFQGDEKSLAGNRFRSACLVYLCELEGTHVDSVNKIKERFNGDRQFAKAVRFVESKLRKSD